MKYVIKQNDNSPDPVDQYCKLPLFHLVSIRQVRQDLTTDALWPDNGWINDLSDDRHIYLVS